MSEQYKKRCFIILVVAMVLLISAIALSGYYTDNKKENKAENKIESKIENKLDDKEKKDAHFMSTPYLEKPTVMGTERYKILGVTMLPIPGGHGTLEPGVIIHLDDGRIRVVAIQQAARDPELLNVNEGYLYRINGQIYLKKN